ncbi:MAG: NADH-quinone oxidoreductase subunit C [Clostridiales bacterium]|nr:NADH-quinone oxidoreductase subunit C [Clostridiales bacterium]
MAKLTYNVDDIDIGELMPRCAAYKGYGWRLCQIHSVRTKIGYELTYSLAKDYELHNFRVTVEETEEVPSITPIYACAWMYENEIAELFGVNIENIRLNYDRKLYKLNVQTPFK